MIEVTLSWSTLVDAAGALILLIGTAFLLVAAAGILRMPDLFLRMSATSKATTLGIGGMLIACGIYFSGDFGISGRVAAIIAFILLTSPVAAHMIGRAAYFNGVPLWPGTRHDELRGRYDLRTHRLDSTRIDLREHLAAEEHADPYRTEY